MQGDIGDTRGGGRRIVNVEELGMSFPLSLLVLYRKAAQLLYSII